MIDPRAALQPLIEATSSYERLHAYETPAELAEHVEAIWRAIDRSLRLLVRGDVEASDELRLNAFATGVLDGDAVLTHLRRRDLVSLGTAGAVHELARVAQRVAGGSVHAADADVAAAAYDGVRRDLSEAHGRPRPAPAPEPQSRSAAEPAIAGEEEHVPSVQDRRRVRRLMLFAAAIFFIGGVAMVIALIRGPASLERESISAFREDRLGVAERGFRALVERNPDHVTAQLYLGRIYRRQGRVSEASEALQAAARSAPADADVRRELGHLFMDLNRPAAAAQQFQQAIELEPGQHANWIALIQSLRAANDPSADDWLRRAPAEVRAALTPVAPQRPFGSN